MHIQILGAKELNGLLSFYCSTTTKTACTSLPPLVASSTLCWRRPITLITVVVIIIIIIVAAQIASNNLHFWRLLSLRPLIRHLQLTLEDSFKLLVEPPIEWD